MSLKELTWEHHKDAERQEFVKVLMSGKINPEFYAVYLWNQHLKYDLLEALALSQNVLEELPSIMRKPAIYADFSELWPHQDPPKTLPSTQEYIQHMRSIMTDKDSLMAHIYVLHMGDLSGGQMIKKRVPGQGRMYEFSGDVPTIKEAIRARTHDGMAEEAKKCFEFSTQLFKEMMDYDIEFYVQ